MDQYEKYNHKPYTVAAKASLKNQFFFTENPSLQPFIINFLKLESVYQESISRPDLTVFWSVQLVRVFQYNLGYFSLFFTGL